MNKLIIDEGTVMDRIDFNLCKIEKKVNEGLKKIDKAN